MKLCIVSSIDENVPPKLYGGIGRVVGLLADGLVQKGYDVTLFAPATSKTKARLIPIIDKPLGVDSPLSKPQIRRAYFRIAINKIIKTIASERFDLISNHLGWRLISFIETSSAPTVTTLHTPLNQPNKQLTFKTYPRVPVISISDDQRKHAPNLNYLATIHNGIDISSVKLSESHGDYATFLGRMSPEKGALEAIKIADKLKVELIMAGAVHTWDKDYFNSSIKPLIDNKNVGFRGELDDQQKYQLLGNAKVLLAPIQWDEPFGLTFIEAMACGTPVITLNRGSVNEIVIDGKTGIVASSTEEICQRFDDISKIDRRECRRHVEKNFTSEIMINKYEETFNQFLKSYEKNK